MQLTHYFWIECLFISLQWSNYQLIQLLKMPCNGCITLENFEQHCESEATEDWVCSGMISFKMPVFGREKIPQILYHCYQYVFSTVNVFLEGDRVGSWWKAFIFLDEAVQEMEESLRAQRLRKGPRTMFSGGPDHPHWMWFWGAP